MKSCYCPNCGSRQGFKVDIPSKVSAPCCSCGKSLVAKADKAALTVKVYDALEETK